MRDKGLRAVVRRVDIDLGSDFDTYLYNSQIQENHAANEFGIRARELTRDDFGHLQILLTDGMSKEFLGRSFLKQHLTNNKILESTGIGEYLSTLSDEQVATHLLAELFMDNVIGYPNELNNLLHGRDPVYDGASYDQRGFLYYRVDTHVVRTFILFFGAEWVSEVVSLFGVAQQ